MKKYDKNKSKNMLAEISRLSLMVKRELDEVERENEKILKILQEKKTSYSKNIVTGISHLEGRTVKRASYLSTSWDHGWILIECEDGQRIALKGSASENYTAPIGEDPENMEKSGFYTDEEIQTRIDYITEEKRRNEKDRERRKREEIKRLQEELEAKE